MTVIYYVGVCNDNPVHGYKFALDAAVPMDMGSLWRERKVLSLFFETLITRSVLTSVDASKV